MVFKGCVYYVVYGLWYTPSTADIQLCEPCCHLHTYRLYMRAHTHTQKQLLQFATVGVLLCVLHMSYSSVFVSIAIQDASVQLLRHIAQYLGKW